MTSVYFVSLGCPKNLVDSEVMLGLLKKEDYQITQDPQNAEVIIVNTCSFIQAAKEESIDTILEMADYKIKGRCQVLVASGCLVQRYVKDLEKKVPEIDLFIGTGEYHKITEALTSHYQALELGDPLPSRTYVSQPAFIHTEKDPRVHTGYRHSAFLKISEGCNRRCAFCIIPQLRGNVRSRTVESLVAEARNFAENGVKELCLVAQDLTEYGMEWKYKERLETLLPELCKIDGIEWIRLHYVYPDQFSDELIEIIAREPKIVKYLDMPIQHTQDLVLKRMNRRLTRENLFQLVAKLRNRIPGVVFRTSIVVGFPGETETEFEGLCRDLQELNLEHVGVFRYSKEEGTKAALMPEQIHPSTARSRVKQLTQILQERSHQKVNEMIGLRSSLLVEGTSEESDLLLEGRLPIQAKEIDGKVYINDLGDLQAVQPGDLVEVEITDSHTYDLVGRVVKMISPAKSEEVNVSA